MALTNQDIVKRIKAARITAGRTQKEVATYLGRTSAAFSDLERGKVQVNAIDLHKLSKYLKMPLEFFYGEDFGGIELQQILSMLRSIEPSDRQLVLPMLRDTVRMYEIQIELTKSTDKKRISELAQEFFGLLQMAVARQKAVTNDAEKLQAVLSEALSFSERAPDEKPKKAKK